VLGCELGNGDGSFVVATGGTGSWNKQEGTTRSDSDVSRARYSWAAYIGRGGEQKGRRWSLTAPLRPLMEIMSLKAQRGEDRD
jgi:hypothetical protein